MTRSAHDASPAGLRGVQEPRILAVPPSVSSAGDEAVDLCRMAGLHLDPWEAFVLSRSLGERPDGKWSAFEVGLIVSRQNGKGAILEGRELAGAFLLGERLIIHSAHQFDTSLEAFRRLLFLIENTPELSRRVKRVSRSHGEEGIELMSRQRIRFRTRTKGGGRGFTGDCLILDEAMILPEDAHGALLPTLSARPNPQVWYTGSAVDQQVHEHGIVLARIRERGHAGDDPSLAYFEWSPDATLDTVESIADQSETWAQANPGLGIRISTEHVERERRSMDPRTFAVERLGVGAWPATGGDDGQVIPVESWLGLVDIDSQPSGPVAFAFDITPDRSMAAISSAGRRSDGLWHGETVEHVRGTGRIVDRLVELTEAHDNVGVACDGAGPAGSLLPELLNRGVNVTAVTAKQYAQACGRLYDAVEQAVLRHLGTPELTSAIRGVTQRVLGGDAWAWSRKHSLVDISPLVAITLALWLSGSQAPAPVPRAFSLADV